MHAAAERAPANVQIERSDGTREYSISVDKDDVTVNAPLPKGNRRADACGELYAKARGTIAAAYGEPRDETEQAMDALTGSIVTARGTNGCGLGWVPPEPERLRAAVVELQQDPSGLADIRTAGRPSSRRCSTRRGRAAKMEREAERVDEREQIDIFDYDAVERRTRTAADSEPDATSGSSASRRGARSVWRRAGHREPGSTQRAEHRAEEPPRSERNDAAAG